MAIDAFDEPAQAASRRTGLIALAATAMTGIAVALVFGGYALLSGTSAPWGWNLGRPVPAAAAPASLEELLPAAPAPAAPAPAAAPRTEARPAARPESRPAARAGSAAALASSALEASLRGAADRCREDGMVPASVRVTATFNAEGAVSDVRADAPAGAANVAGCLALAARKVTIPGFDGDPVTIQRAITVR